MTMLKHMKARYACVRPSKQGLRTGMRHARKKGQIGLHAHPSVLPFVGKTRKPLSKHDWHVAYIIRRIKRGQTVSDCDLKSD